MTTTGHLSPARAELLRRRLRRGLEAAPVIGRRADGASPPPSFAQERLWFMDQLVPDSAAYALPLAVRLRGALDPADLRRALGAVVDRHETLRTRFESTADGRPVAVVAPPGSVPVPLSQHEVDPRLPEAEREAAARTLVSRFAAQPFDVGAGPLVRAALIRLTEADHVLVAVLHHIAADGWSLDVFLADLLRAWQRVRDGAGEDPGGPEPAVRYGDYAAWQREQYTDSRLADDLAYWSGRLTGVPPLELPTDHPRPARPRLRGASLGFDFGERLGHDVVRLARRLGGGSERGPGTGADGDGRDGDGRGGVGGRRAGGGGVTPYMVLLAAFQALLCRYADQDDFAVGTTVAGRDLPELEQLVGLFANVLALRADLAGDPTFAELVGRVRERVLDGFSHQEMPFDRLVAHLRVPRDASRSPVFQVLFTMLNYRQGGLPEVGLRVDPFPVDARATRFDLELYVSDPDTGRLSGTVIYDADLFDAGTVERFVGHLERLVRAVVADPTLRVSQIPLLDDAERDLVLRGFNDTALDIGPPRTLAELVEAQVRRTPDAVAVTFERKSLTYAELNARANALAHRLRCEEVGAGSLVAVCAERGLELVVALLAVVKAGAAYLPLDPEYPPGRLAFMLTDAAPRVLLTTPNRAAAFADHEVTIVPLGGDRADPRDPTPVATPDDIAYVIYTSGSTGRPKGVPNTHRGIHNRLDWMQRTFRLGPDDVVLQKTPASFDVSVWEFFWPLSYGARLVLARPGGHKDAAYLRDLIIRERVTTVHFVPSMLSVFLAEEGVEDCRSLRRVIASGEALPADLARAFHRRLDGELYNLYGPTEAAIDVTWWHCRPEALETLARVPIGRPIQNTRLYVLDRAGAPVPVGVPGELHIAGVCLSPGYLNRPELTARKFRDDPYGPPGGRMYATGDLARFTPDGTIEFLGRLDQQVKLRGQRIELGEIEAVLRGQDGVADAVVTVREDRPGDQRLVAYVVPGVEGGEPDPAALRSALKRVLPDYMVPSVYVPLSALPVTPNGKLDRRALPPPPASAADAERFVAPRTDLEATVAAVWAQVLDLPRVGIDDDFFDLGGHSLLATQVVARLRNALPADAAPVSVMDLFKHPTVRQLAALAGTPPERRGPRRLLHELTRPLPDGDRPTLTLICVPYGGGSAVVYQPLADALPDGYRLLALAIPGHDLGVTEQHVAVEEIVTATVAEIAERVDGPVAVYGHCGVGSALAVGLGLALEATGRPVEAVYIGGVFPFARPAGRFAALQSWAERLRSDRHYANWLTSLGLDLNEIGPEQARALVRNLRKDNQAAEDYFTRMWRRGADRLRAPVISVVGERDDLTMFYEERFREWHFLSDTTALFVLDEAGHYFLKYRADELAAILTLPVDQIDAAAVRRPVAGPTDGRPVTWWLHDVSTTGAGAAAGRSSHAVPDAAAPPAEPLAAAPGGAGRSPARAGPAPSMRRFLGIAGTQMVSMTTSAVTGFAVPLWIYLETGSLVNLALFSAISLVPGMLVLPVAGVIVDRHSRRAVMLASDTVSGATQAALLSLVLTGRLEIWHIYLLLIASSVAVTFHRLAYSSAIPQLVPKRYLGHANGLVQLGNGVGQFLVPIAAVGVLAAVGLEGILVLDLVGFAVAVTVLALTRFPARMAFRRRETLMAEIRSGFRYAMGSAGLRSMLLFFAASNLFLGPLLILLQPLVLGFGTMRSVTEVAVAGGVGTIAGGVLMALWGGPVRRKMLGVLGAAAALAVAAGIAGLRPSVAVTAVGVFGLYAGLTVMNAIYATIVQVKVPARFHGRVFAVNTLFAFCTLPVGFIVIGPAVSEALNPLLTPDGALAGTVGRVIGTGEGRGIGLAYLLFGAAILLLVAAALRFRPLARFDLEVPDAEPDDLIGLAELRRRAPDGRTDRRGGATDTLASPD